MDVSEPTSSATLHIEFLGQAITTALSAVDDVSGNTEQSHVLALGLCATILELGAGALALAQQQRYAGIPILLRSVYEAHIDLINLLKNATYAFHLEASDIEQQIRILKEAQSYPNSSGLRVDAGSQIAQLTERLSQLRQQGYAPLQVKERAARADPSGQHRMAYPLLCLDTHNSASSLADRHFSESDRGRFVTIFGEPYLPSLRGRLFWLNLLVVDATTALHCAFRTNSSKARDLQDAFERVQGELRAGT